MASILVADDDPLMRAIVHEILTQDGHDVVEVADGQEAVVLFGARRFDLVITDMLMPGMDGIELIGALRSARPDVKILAISSGGRFGSDGVLRWGRAVGADEVMAKPLSAAALCAVVTRLLAAEGRRSP